MNRFSKIIFQILIVISSNYLAFSQNADPYFGWEGHYGPVLSITHNKTGTLLLTGGDDGTIRVWNLNDNSLVRTLLSKNKKLTSLSVSPDNTKLVSTGPGSESFVEVWDINSGSLIKTLSRPSISLKTVTFSRDGKKIASCLNGIYIWDLNSGSLIRSFTDKYSESVVFSTDGLKIISGDSLGNVEFSNITTGASDKTFAAHQSKVTAIALSPDGTRLATGSHDKRLNIWDINGTLINPFIGHYNDVVSLDFSTDGTKLASCAYDKTVRIWGLFPGNLLHTFHDNTEIVNSVSLSPDGSKMVAGSNDATIMFFDVSSDEYPTPWSFMGHTAKVASIAFSPDGNNLITGGYDNKVKLWDATFGILLKNFSGQISPIIAAAFTSDGTKIISAGADSRVKVWNATTSASVSTVSGQDTTITSIAFSPDRSQFACAGNDNLIKLRDAKNGSLIKSFTGHLDTIKSIAFSPNGILLASASVDKTIKLWNVTNESIIYTINSQATTLAFSPDGTTLLSGSFSCDTLFLWDVGTGIIKKTFNNTSKQVSSVAYSPNGKIFAISSYDGTIRIWKDNNQLPIKIINFEQGYPIVICFSPDGKVIASAGWGYNNIRIYNISDLLKTDILEIPKSFSLSQNYPNPFNPSTKIEYFLPENTYVRLTVHNILGQEVYRMVDKYQIKGYYKIEWKPINLPGGIYFYNITTGKIMETKKMTFLK